MPWKETCTMQERRAFIEAWLSHRFGMSELCRRFGVSRPTGYKWLERFKEGGFADLCDRSRAPLNHPNKSSEQVVAQLLAAKRRYPWWGPEKLVGWLGRQFPDVGWPAVSTAGEILKRHGLVKTRKKRHRTPPHSQPLAHASAANAVWSADYKGQFKLGDGRWCYPLTLTDNYSRYLIDCKGLYGPRLKPSQARYEQAFRSWGLPAAIRTDNGYPFAGVAIGGLTALSIWLLKLGVLPERIAPGQPQQNPRHERMHRTLKAATASPPKGNLAAQQRAFNRFMSDYNEQRPHQALGHDRCPADVFEPSTRPFPEVLPEITYPDHYQVRKIRYAGQMKWHGDVIYVSRQLVGEHIGLEQMEHDQWQLYFAQLPLGVFDARTRKITRPGQ